MSGLVTNYLAAGVAASRPATPSITTGATSFYYATDTDVLSVWDGSAWDSVIGAAGAQTLTNKRITKRVLVDTSNSATPTLNTDNYDVMRITGQTTNITSMSSSLSGTPTDMQPLIICFTAASGTPTLAWGATFEASTIALPTALSTTMLMVGFFWNTVTSKWRCVASA